MLHKSGSTPVSKLKPPPSRVKGRVTTISLNRAYHELPDGCAHKGCKEEAVKWSVEVTTPAIKLKGWCKAHG